MAGEKSVTPITLSTAFPNEMAPAKAMPNRGPGSGQQGSRYYNNTWTGNGRVLNGRWIRSAYSDSEPGCRCSFCHCPAASRPTHNISRWVITSTGNMPHNQRTRRVLHTQSSISCGVASFFFFLCSLFARPVEMQCLLVCSIMS